ncbi:hypothetical protein K501DRAFT_325117 [Backusella circina FSU 941]|nr:hypothetical protein K501DRAFT_325117 [Backusella circina FSU 941]
MATRHRRKTNPCEGCRERKKKCSTGQPCERCKRLGITCHYIKQITPPTVDYLEMISNQELKQNVDQLRELMATMEDELQVVRTTTATNSSNKKLKNQDYQPNWQFSIGPLGITIHTDITSVQGLLFHIKALGALSDSILHPPTIPNRFYQDDDLLERHLLSSTLRRGNFQVLTKSIKSIQFLNGSSDDAVVYHDTILNQQQTIMKQLVNTYFSCQFFNSVLFHERTFRRLFINGQRLEQSPVACAICAVVLTIHCKHVLNVISYDQQMSWAHHFFKSARDVISMEFDTISLETVITYLLLAIYKANILRIEEAKVYLDMALRIRQLLQDEVYNNNNSMVDPGEYETFKRLHKGFRHLCGFIQFLNRERGVPTRGKSYMEKKKNDDESQNKQRDMIRNIFKLNFSPTPFDDESLLTARVIMKDVYALVLSGAIGSYLNRVRCGKDDMIPLSYVVKTEANLKEAYFQKIPSDFQLSMSIFEDGLDDVDFWKRLKDDPRCDLASVALATQYFQILVSLHEPFLPVLKKASHLPSSCSLITDDHLPVKAEESNDDETSSSSSFNSSQDHSLRAQDICFKSAIIVVRLLEYQCTMLPACTIARPTLLSVWDIHMRNACLGMSEEEFVLSPQNVQTAREYAIRCIGVLKRGYLFNAAERQIWEYYQNIEDQLLRALYGADSPPTAHYFEPAHSPSFACC